MTLLEIIGAAYIGLLVSSLLLKLINHILEN